MFESHPDKIAGPISDAILCAILAEDKYARVECETMVRTGVAIVSGEITTSSWIDLEDLVRGVINDIGYTSSDVGYDGNTCGLINTIGNGKISEEKIIQLVREHFDLRPYAITNMLDLLRPMYRQTAAYGHFCRNPFEMTVGDDTFIPFPWESTDIAAQMADNNFL